MTYSDKLKSPLWQKKRLEILSRDKWECQHCGDHEKTLHVHHLRYRGRKEPWDQPDTDFLSLCERCHVRATAIQKALSGTHDVPAVNEASETLQTAISLVLEKCYGAEELAQVLECFNFICCFAETPSRWQLGIHDKPLAVRLEQIKQAVKKDFLDRLEACSNA